MRLRGRLTLSFFLTALPAALVAGAAVMLFDRLVEQESNTRAAATIRQARAVVASQQKRVRSAVDALGQSGALRRLARDIKNRQAVIGAESLAADRAAAAGLDVFAIIAVDGPFAGTIVSSAHLPASVGDKAPPFIKDSPNPSDSNVGFVHALIEGNPPALVPALVAVGRVPNAQGQNALLVYGGNRLDGQRLASIAEMARARLVLESPGLTALEFQPQGQFSQRLETRGTVELTALPGGRGDLAGKNSDPGGKSTISVAVPRSRLAAARRLFVGVAAGLVVFALLLALVAGGLLSGRITRPVTDLSNAAKEIGRGNLEVSLAATSSDEIGDLVRVFKTMTEEIRESRTQLARAERLSAWREIARRVAHEIKNPLFPIQMSMETLRKSFARKHPKLDEIVDESTRTVLEEVQALNRLVTEFSEFARLPAPKPELVSPASVLEHVADLYAHEQAEVRLELPEPPLPDVEVDREQLARALINLVKNAIEAMGETAGRIVLRLQAESRSGRPGIVITIADDGPGIPDTVRDRLFTPYFTTKETGTGLGLAIVERVISEHGGTIQVSSVVDVGTSFAIWLPNAAPKPSDAA